MVLKHILLLLVESFELVSYKIGRSYVYGGGKYYVMLCFTFLINLDLKCATIFGKLSSVRGYQNVTASSRFLTQFEGIHTCPPKSSELVKKSPP